MWPANNCLQIVVCSSTMSSIFVWLQIIFCSWVNKTKLFSLMRLLLRENGRSLRFPKIFNKTIIQLGYCKISWFVSVSQINYLPLLTTDTGLKMTLTAGRQTWWPAKYFLARTNPDSGWSNNEYYSFFFAQGISNYPGNNSLLLHWHSHFWYSKLLKNVFAQIVEFLSAVFACFNVRSTSSIIVGSVWSL